jgi:hypothetical protein
VYSFRGEDHQLECLLNWERIRQRSPRNPLMVYYTLYINTKGVKLHIVVNYMVYTN